MPDNSDDKTLTAAAAQVSFASVGPYRLIQLLGVGGMGEVWRAEQTEPFHRTVALKLIKAGMDTKAVVARFDSERQALALMEHANIAKVFDAVPSAAVMSGSTGRASLVLATRWLPQLRALHAFPDVRFAATHPR